MIRLPLQPMEPLLWPEAFDSSDWVFQIKWDGMRVITVVREGRVQAFNRHGDDRTAWFPELSTLVPLLHGRDALLDGEAVALLGGKPSFRRLMQRIRSREPAALAQEVPVFYVVFDLLEEDGEDLRQLPWEARDARLRQILSPGGAVSLVDSVIGEGKRLFAAAQQHDLEGVVAKRLDSPYVAGKNGLWRKVKDVKRRPFVIAGFRRRGGRLASLLLAAYDEGGRLVYVGNAGTGLDERTMEALHEVLRESVVTDPPPLLGRPRAPGDSADVWVFPALTVLVEFLEWTADEHLRAPVIRALNPARPADCRLE